MGANPEYANGEVIANKFVVEGFLGESPAGRIYSATGNPASQRTAVKFYKSDVSARLLASPDFFLKASVMTEIEHDNLCACYDVQEEMGNVFVARAFAEGMSFEEWARKHRSDGNYFARGLELLWQATQGLAALHERTRHLNIHPGNLIVGPLVAKLCDWDPRALASMEMIPEPLPVRPEYQGYRAPEALSRSGGALSYPSTDLYAVAALLLRLVRGEHPSADFNKTFADARSLDKDLSQFLSKALHPRAEERFQEAGAFSDALWDLQGAMQRLQESGTRSGSARASSTSAPAAAPRREEPVFPAPRKAASGNDTFFGSFAKEDAAPAKSAGDTLFGEPTVKSSSSGSGISKPLPYAQPQPSFAPPPPPLPPTKAPPAKSGLSALESSGTLFGGEKTGFGADKTSFGAPAQSTPNPGPAKPLAVSLSSLEKDPMDMTQAGGAGMTQYGFKGAGDANRTGEFQREAPSARRKLGILLIGAGALVLLLGMGALFLYLRNTAAPKETETVRAGNDDAAPRAEPRPVREPEPEPVAQPAAAAHPEDAPPYPEESSQPAPPPKPKPVSRPQPEPAPKPVAPKPKPVPTTAGASSITLERQEELMRMIQARDYPAGAAERLRAGDELNDLGKTAEANLLYGKTLLAADITTKQKVSAFGGLAVTFQKMGMKDQALDAVNRLLELNPRNSFALKMKEQLR